MIEIILTILIFAMILLFWFFEPKFEIIKHNNRRIIIIWYNKYDKIFFKDNTCKRDYILIDFEKLIYGR